MTSTKAIKPALALCGSALLLATLTATASAATPEAVAEACGAGTNLPAEVCSCIGDDSAELSEDQRAFYVAAAKQDEAETTRLRLGMSPNDLIDIVTFMRTAPVECAKKGS